MSNGEILGLVIQTVGVVSVVWLALTKRRRDDHRAELKEVERYTEIKTKVDALYHWWEYKIERRPLEDEKRYISSQKERRSKGED